MKNIKTTLNNLTTSANKEQQERIAYLLRAITNLENDDINTAASFVQLADCDNKHNIISAEDLANMVRGLGDIGYMLRLLSDVKHTAEHYRLNGYGWALNIDADVLKLYVMELTDDVQFEIKHHNI